MSFAAAFADHIDPPEEPDLATPAAFAEAHSRGQWKRARHLDLVEQACLDTIATSGRLILSISVRHGKSEFASKWLPAWYLGRNPDKRVILAGHEADFAMSWGRQARDILTEHGDRFGVRVSKASSAASRWDLESPRRGAMLTVGVGGSPIGRGADLCVVAGTMVETPQGPTDITTLAGRGGTVWAYDHDTRSVVESRITAATESESDDLVEITFTSGRVIRCTPDHPIYVDGAGYVDAERLTIGASVKTLGVAQLPSMRRGVPADGEGASPVGQAGQTGVLLEELRVTPPRHAPTSTTEAPRVGHGGLRGVLDASDHAGVVVGQEGQQGSDGRLLQPDVQWPGAEDHTDVRAMRRAKRQEATPVLSDVHHPATLRDSSQAGAEGVRVLHGPVPADLLPTGVLLKDVRQPSARRPDGRVGQLPLQGRDELRRLVPQDAPADHRTGRRLRRVWDHRPPAHSPHRREPDEQHADEPRDTLPRSSHHAPQVGHDTVAMVRHLRTHGHLVYDLTVDGTHNFFAGQVLVHNCIVDDPIKSYADAMSPLVRKRVKDWWTGTMVSRIEPGGAVILIMARWHEDDLAGFLLREEPDQWRELRMPAIADEPGDAMGREIGEALWPERFDAAELARRKQSTSLSLGEAVWLAQYQQRPTTPTGGMFPVDKWQHIDYAPPVERWVRGWDLAATEGGGDYTVGALVGRAADGRTVVADVVRGQWGSHDVRSTILATATNDPPGTRVVLPQDPGQAGKAQAQQYAAMLAGFDVLIEPQTGSKEVRATGWAAQQQAGNVALVVGGWRDGLVAEHQGFPRGTHDDTVDACSSAFNALVGRSESVVTEYENTALYDTR